MFTPQFLDTSARNSALLIPIMIPKSQNVDNQLIINANSQPRPEPKKAQIFLSFFC